MCISVIAAACSLWFKKIYLFYCFMKKPFSLQSSFVSCFLFVLVVSLIILDTKCHRNLKDQVGHSPIKLKKKTCAGILIFLEFPHWPQLYFIKHTCQHE